MKNIDKIFYILMAVLFGLAVAGLFRPEKPDHYTKALECYGKTFDALNAGDKAAAHRWMEQGDQERRALIEELH